MRRNTIQEYLVSIGVETDKKGLAAAKTLLRDVEGAVGKMGGVVVKAAKAYGLLQTAIIGANVAIAKFVSHQANQDLEMQRFAMRMFSSKAAADDLTTSLKAMGKSLEDIPYMTPEEYQRFQELRRLNASIAMPEDYAKTMRQIRDVQFEWTKIKLLLANGARQIAYAIFKHSGATIEEWRKKLVNLGKYLQKHLPSISDKVAKVADIFIRLGGAVGRVAELIGRFIKLLAEDIPKNVWVAGGVITGFISLLSMGPLGAFMAAILALLLLMDDVATWERGGKSLFGDFYDSVAKVMDKLKQNGTIDTLQNSFRALGDSLGDVVSLFTDLLDCMDDTKEKGDFLFDLLKKFFDGLSFLLAVARYVVETFEVLLSGKWKNLRGEDSPWAHFKEWMDDTSLRGNNWFVNDVLGMTPLEAAEWLGYAPKITGNPISDMGFDNLINTFGKQNVTNTINVTQNIANGSADINTNRVIDVMNGWNKRIVSGGVR